MDRELLEKAIIVVGLLAAGIALAEEAAAPQTDGEVWNAGVDYYRAGDVTNALETLKKLRLSRTHGARAAEVMAKLEYENGDREAAAEDAQIALRDAPDDAKANRNFTRAIDRLHEIREEAHIAEVMKQAQGQDAGAMLRQATHVARALMTGAAGLATNPPARAVALADQYAQSAQGLVDVWIPVRDRIAQSVTNEEQAATIFTQVENAKRKTKAAALGLEDMDENAYSALSDAEHDLTRFLKMTILPPAAMDEGETAQTNAWQDVEPFNGRAWQQDALDYTQSFRTQFPAWAREYEQKAQSDTNMPPFTAEDQAKVSALATELEKTQLACVEKNLPTEQEKALGIIRQIKALLPKDKNGGQGQQNQQQQNQQNQNKQNQQDQQQEQQDQDQQNNQDQQNEAKESEAQESDEKPEDKEVQAVLKKAQERSDEHEQEKKMRMRKASLPPNTRDW